MDFIVKDKNVRPIAVVDLYTSAIWAERYCDTGDFELYLPLNSSYLEYLAIGNYLMIKDSDRAMIIESVQMESKLDTGEKLVMYKGRTLESILDRRIVLGPVSYTASISQIVQWIIQDNAVAPSNPARAIPNLSYGGAFDSYTASYLNSLPQVECKFDGENLLEALKSICEPANLGFKIVFNDSGYFVFYLYYGIDRSSQQVDRDPIIFSPEYDTLISSRFLQNYAGYRNVAIIDGEDQEDIPRQREQAYYGETEPSGLERREMHVNASDIKEDDFGTDYGSALIYRGLTELQDNYVTSVFDGEVETKIGPQFNTDYFLGDFVTVKNEFDLSSVAQITEYIRSYDAKGYSAYPTFVMIN